MLEVAHDSYALTLWQCWHLDRRRSREAAVDRDARFDLAGLINLAVHDPAKLSAQMSLFRSSLVATPAAPRRERLSAAEHIAAHQRMRPLPVQAE